MRYPKDIEVWEHAPGKKIAEVVIRLRNERGALAACSDAVTECGVDILTGFFTAPSNSNVATMSFFADVSDATDGLQRIRRRLKDLTFIESVDAIAAEDDFMVDKHHFPLRWAGRRAVVMRAAALNEMLNRLWDVFGSGAATIIDQMAEAMGKHFAREVIDDLGSELATRQLDELIGTYTALGYAEVAIERSKSSDFPLVVNAKDLFECDANSTQGLARGSIFFRAHIRGFMSGLFGVPFEVSEVQCLTDGDEVCSFRLAITEAQSETAAVRVPSHDHEGRHQSNL